MNVNWIDFENLNKTGQILALCQDNTGIYNQLMMIIVTDKNQKAFYENGILGQSHRVYPDKIKAAIYLDDICSTEIINKFCQM
jgi:hypothetical protein